MEEAQYIDQAPQKAQSIADLARHFVVTKPRGRRELLEEIYSYYDKTLPIARFCIKMNICCKSLQDLHYVLSVAKDMDRRGQNFSAYITQYFK